jgi:hypothetical protein
MFLVTRYDPQFCNGNHEYRKHTINSAHMMMDGVHSSTVGGAKLNFRHVDRYMVTYNIADSEKASNKSPELPKASNGHFPALRQWLHMHAQRGVEQDRTKTTPLFYIRRVNAANEKPVMFSDYKQPI